MQGNSTGKKTSARISHCPTDLNSIEGTKSFRPTQPGTCHPAKTLLPVYPKDILIPLVTVKNAKESVKTFYLDNNKLIPGSVLYT